LGSVFEKQSPSSLPLYSKIIYQYNISNFALKWQLRGLQEHEETTLSGLQENRKFLFIISKNL
jgi:hypothetical protein